MRLHDPDRPKVAGRPAYLSPSGRPIAALPGLIVTPLEPELDSLWERWTLTCWLITSPLAASQYDHQISAPWGSTSLNAALTAWLTSPEDCMKNWWGYGYEPPHGAVRQVTATVLPTLEELGL